MSWPDKVWIAAYLVALAGVSLYGVHRYVILFLFLRYRGKLDPVAREFETLPLVTVQLPVYNERHVARRLLRAVGELDYPRDRLEIQILDDSTDETAAICEEEAARLRREGLDVTVLRRKDRAGFKAGALAEALPLAKGEFLYILDADFRPGRSALRDAIHYLSDEQVGLVQTRWGHLNRDHSILTRIQAIYLDAHFQLEQVARFRAGRFIHFNGTAGILRKAAVEDAGGWDGEILTEDLDLSYRAQLRGWKFVYLNDVVTPAELPADMAGFRSQQFRWAKGSIQTWKRLIGPVWKSGQPWPVKLEATAHLSAHFAYVFVALLSISLVPALGALPLEAAWVSAMHGAVFLLASVSVALFYVLSSRRNQARRWWSDLALLPVLMAAGIGLSLHNARGILEALAGRRSEFVRTPKYGVESGEKETRFRSPYRSAKRRSWWMETIMTLYFSAVVVAVLWKGEWMTAPFLLLFLGGFGYVAWPSVRRLFAG